jgi:hypothetical protein
MKHVSSSYADLCKVAYVDINIRKTIISGFSKP